MLGLANRAGKQDLVRGEGSFSEEEGMLGLGLASSPETDGGGGLRLSGEVDIILLAGLQAVFQRRACYGWQAEADKRGRELEERLLRGGAIERWPGQGWQAV